MFFTLSSQSAEVVGVIFRGCQQCLLCIVPSAVCIVCETLNLCSSDGWVGGVFWLSAQGRSIIVPAADRSCCVSVCVLCVRGTIKLIAVFAPLPASCCMRSRRLENSRCAENNTFVSFVCRRDSLELLQVCSENMKRKTWQVCPVGRCPRGH